MTNQNYEEGREGYQPRYNEASARAFVYWMFGEGVDKSRIEQISQQKLDQAIDAVLNTITYQERAVLVARYGLEDGRTQTFKELETSYKANIARRIEAKAIRKLRHPVRIRKLEEILGNLNQNESADK